eukprot:1195900-Prorocentrum_minimum.AAC.7
MISLSSSPVHPTPVQYSAQRTRRARLTRHTLGDKPRRSCRDPLLPPLRTPPSQGAPPPFNTVVGGGVFDFYKNSPERLNHWRVQFSPQLVAPIVPGCHGNRWQAGAGAARAKPNARK